MEERLQKLMSQAGIASRRASEALIEQGRVMVNGQRASIGDKADPAKDDIRVDGVRLHISTERIYIMLNKPTNVVTTVLAQSQEERRTVRDLVLLDDFLYPVGRLDADSEGLILLTNDGDLAEKLTHPRYQHPKVYDVAVYGHISDPTLDVWRRGITLDDGPTKPVKIQVISRDKDISWLRITMQEGRKRQIRRIARTLHHPVNKLIRTEFGTLTLADLPVGQWRYLTPEEIESLRKSTEDIPVRKSGKRQGASHSRSGSGIRTVPSPTTHNANRSGSRSTDRMGNRDTTRRDTPRQGAAYSSERTTEPSADSDSRPTRSYRPRSTGSGSSRPSRPASGSSKSSSSGRSERSGTSTTRTRRPSSRPGTRSGSRAGARPGSSSNKRGSTSRTPRNSSNTRNTTRSRSNKRNDDR